MLEVTHAVQLTQTELTWWRLLRMGPFEGCGVVDSLLRKELKYSQRPWRSLSVDKYGDGSRWLVRIEYVNKVQAIKDPIYKSFLHVCRDK